VFSIVGVLWKILVYHRQVAHTSMKHKYVIYLSDSVLVVNGKFDIPVNIQIKNKFSWHLLRPKKVTECR
jgi:hypothetical protein